MMPETQLQPVDDHAAPEVNEDAPHAAVPQQDERPAAPAASGRWTGLFIIMAVLAGLAAVALAVLPGQRSSQPPAAAFRGTELNPPLTPPSVPLLNEQGLPVRLSDFTGQVTALYFGYTNCPDECPTTLAMLERVRTSLGDDGAQFRAELITVDPVRDTPQRLAAFVHLFDPAFGGLTGSQPALRQVYQAFSVVVNVDNPDQNPDAYRVGHTSLTYLLDQQGRLRLAYAPTATAADIAADVRLLLHGQGNH